MIFLLSFEVVTEFLSLTLLMIKNLFNLRLIVLKISSREEPLSITNWMHSLIFFLCNNGFDKKIALKDYISFKFYDTTDFGRKTKEVYPKRFLYETNQCKSYYYLYIVKDPENLDHGHTPFWT